MSLAHNIEFLRRLPKLNGINGLTAFGRNLRPSSPLKEVTGFGANPIGAALVALHIGVSQAEPIKMVTARRGPERICEWSQYYLPLLPMPWCELPAKRP